MACDKYFELISARLDGALTEAEERELEVHLAACPECRAAAAQLAALQAGFDGLEDVAAPEGFAQSVMDRIRTEESRPKVIPLFKRPQFRALAGLAACLVLVVGLYSAAQPHTLERTVRITVQDAQAGSLDVPEITAYCDSGIPAGGTEELPYGVLKTAPEVDGYDGTDAAPMVSTAILMLDRMPEGAWELIPSGTAIPPEGISVTKELFEKIEQLAREEEITASRTSVAAEAAEEFVIVVLEEIK